MEELQKLTEEFSQPVKERAKKPGSQPGSLKRKAAQYLGKGAGEKLSRTDLKRLRAKANKMKKSTNKAERARGNQLYRQVMFVYNMSD